MSKFDITNYINIFNSPDRICKPYSWVEHIPFAFFLINILKPDMFVELGVHTGNSYFAFCQAVKELNLNTKCYGVDIWKGDLHSEFYDESIYKDVSEYNEKSYKHFSSLMRMTFNDAFEFFSDCSIDILHIDGFHEYESVKNDFKNWLPKMSNRGIILLHDINVHEKVRGSNFGVWKLWEEVTKSYKSFNFDFGY